MLVVTRSEIVTKSKEKEVIHKEPRFTSLLGSILLKLPINSITKAMGEASLRNQNGQYAGNY